MMLLELRRGGILDDRIFNAITSFSRDLFLPDGLKGFANEDLDLKIIINDDSGNQLTLSVDLSEITEAFTDKVGGMVTGGTESFIDVSYDDTNDRLDFTVATKDEDDMSSNSATHLPTQQSVKAYVDSQVTAQDLDFQADSGGALSIDLSLIHI